MAVNLGKFNDPSGNADSWVYVYDADFGSVKKHIVKSGNTLMGIQTAAFAKDCWWFGCYGDPRMLLKTDEAFGLLGKYECNASLGIVGLPNGRLFVARGSCQPQKGCVGSVLVARADEEEGLAIEKEPQTLR